MYELERNVHFCWQKHVIHVNKPKPILLPIAADLSGQMFFMEYELRPLHIKADQSLKMTVRPVEIFYDQVLLLVSYIKKKTCFLSVSLFCELLFQMLL